MKQELRDVVRFTHELGGEFEAFKVLVKKDGTAEVKSSSKDMSIVLNAKVKGKLPNLFNQMLDDDKKTTVGFSRLNVLAGYLNSPVFNEGGTLDVNYKETSGTPAEIIFKSNMGHTCTYRFMNPEAVKQKVKSFRLANGEIEYDVSFTPREVFVKEFNHFASILSGFCKEFSFSVSDGTLYMHLGDDDTVKLPVCETECTKLNSVNSWPIKQVQSILRQAPSVDAVTFSISDDMGMIEIEVNTDHASYQFHINSI